MRTTVSTTALARVCLSRREFARRRVYQRTPRNGCLSRWICCQTSAMTMSVGWSCLPTWRPS
ncbi:hypothetical protein [Kibdelosporangium philippinense]|uniref:hypothetical protein n=1 Tax=Kibdelosporangium philippinense TaxID=211113 RepID=UPI0036129FFA